MKKYNCIRCGYNTSNKQNLKKHFLRKFICQPKLKEVPIYDLLITNEFFNDAKKYIDHLKHTQKVSKKHIQKYTQNNVCKFCNKILSNYNSKWRHEKKCSLKFPNIKTENNKIKDELKAKEKENKFLIDKINSMNNDIQELKDIINKTNNYQQNNINNGIINNFYIKNYGEENIDYITNKIKKNLLMSPGSAISKLIVMIHFNEKHKENLNIKLTNINNPYIYVYKDNTWVVKRKSDLINDMIDDKFNILDIFLNEESEKELIKKKNLLESKVDNKDKDKFLYDLVFQTLYENSKKVIKYHTNTDYFTKEITV